MKSDGSKCYPPDFSNEPGPPHTKSLYSRPESPTPSCVSMKSDGSKCYPPDFSNEPGPPHTKERFRTTPEPKTSSQTTSGQNVSLQEHLSVYKISLNSLDRVTEHISEETGTSLSRIYTELYIIVGESEGVNNQHEVWQLEILSKKTLNDTPFNCCEIFKHLLPDRETPIRCVLTMGIAGIGKTFSARKFTLDWAKGLENQDINLLVPFSFRELNLVRDEQHSLLTLIHVFHPTLKKVTAEQLATWKVGFIFDGLDESRFSFNFDNNDIVCDVKVTTSVDVLLTNLIKGNLLPSALLWITTRPAAANQIPPACVDMVTEVRGFTDSQKEEFFRKRFSDEKLASRIISHMKTSKSIHIMCHVPVFCSMTATVLEDMVKTDETVQLPKTLVAMYIHYLLVQINMKKQKYDETHEVNQQQFMKTDRDVLLKLGRLAFGHLEKGIIMFYQEDLEECGLDVKDASLYSGVCTAIFRREGVLFQKMVYSFVHLSIQEFLAAVYLFHCFTQRNMEVLKTFLDDDDDDDHDIEFSRGITNDSSLSDFLEAAMKKALQSKNGHLDLFVRFLHGLSLDSNQSLLEGLLGQTENSPEEIQKAITNLKEMNDYRFSPDRCINIFHCLMEMNDPSVSQGIQQYLESENRSGKELSLTQCSALASMLLMSEEVLEELDLEKYNTSEDGRWRLIPAVRNSRKARLVGCKLKREHIEVVASALSSNPSHLRHLDLSYNNLVGLELLDAALKSPHCRLETLRLVGCNLQKEHIEIVASALSSNPSHLRHLDLSSNNLMDLELLDAALKSPHCRLETLRLIHCWLSERSCEVLASALSSNPSYLRELDLTLNGLQDSGMELLCAGVKSPNCHLQTLRLSGCGITEKGCSSLASAVALNPSSHLKHVDLSCNHPQGDAVQTLLSAGLETVNVNHGGEHWIDHWMNPVLLSRYFRRLTMDTNTAWRTLSLSENNRKVTRGGQDQNYPPHPDRFDAQNQFLCTEGLTGRSFCEVECSGGVDQVALTYRAIGRKGHGYDCLLGYNDKSWSLNCCIRGNNYSVVHNCKETILPVSYSRGCNRVAVYLDSPAGTLSFYTGSKYTLTHLYTFQNTFTEPMYVGFRFNPYSTAVASVFLCEQR